VNKRNTIPNTPARNFLSFARQTIHIPHNAMEVNIGNMVLPAPFIIKIA
jgi:hypothetical protein